MSVNNEIIIGSTNARIELYTVDNKGIPNKMYIPVLLDDIEWSSANECNPATLKYTVLKDSVINFGLGTKTVLKVNEKPVFIGYTMYKHRTSDVKIECTAYDQMRYLKTKVSRSFEEKSVTEIVKELLSEYELQTGAFDALTELKILSLVADQKEILEIISGAMDSHTVATGENLVFYDDAGRLRLRKMSEMRITNQFFHSGEMQDWDYTSSIEDSYNSIVVDVLDEAGENHTGYITAEDEGSQKRWGLLRYTAQSNEEQGTIQAKADVLLSMLNRETRTLKLEGCFGNVNVRGGSLIAVKLNLGDMELYSWMVVKEVTHTINQDGYWMDITAENSALGFADPVDPEGVFTVEKASSEEGSSVAGEELPGNTNAEKIWNALRAEGFSKQATAGVMGNMACEAGTDLNPAQPQYGGPGMGLCQWERSGGGSGRFDILTSWANSNGLNPLTIEAQCKFINYEVTNNIGGMASIFTSYTQATWAQFKAATDVETATKWFLWGYEIAGVQNVSDRVQWANTYYNQYKDYGVGHAGKFKDPDPNVIDPNNKGYRNQCTWYVFNRIYQLTGKSIGKIMGNGGEWADYARSYGYRVYTKPFAGAAACWRVDPRLGYGVGHIAFVEKVNTDGSIEITEMWGSEANGVIHRTTMSSDQAAQAQYIDFGVK